MNLQVYQYMCDRELVTVEAAAPLPYSIDSPITGCDGVLIDRYKNALITVKELGPGQSLIATRALHTQLWTYIVLSPLGTRSPQQDSPGLTLHCLQARKQRLAHQGTASGV